MASKEEMVWHCSFSHTVCVRLHWAHFHCCVFMNTFISRQTMNNIFFWQSVNWTCALSKTWRFLWTCSLWRDNRCSTLLPKILGDGPFNVARFSLLKPLTDIHICCAPRQDESSKPGVPKLLHVMACQTAELESCWEPTMIHDFFSTTTC